MTRVVHGTGSDRGHPRFSRNLPLSGCRTTRCVDLADSVNCPFLALFRRLDLRFRRPAQTLASAQFTARPWAASARNHEFGRRDIVWRAPRYRAARMGGLGITISSRAKWCRRAERPAHPGAIRPFCLARTEIRRAIRRPAKRHKLGRQPPVQKPSP